MTEIEIKVLKLFYGLLVSQPTINRAYDCLKVLFEKTIESYESGFEEKVTYSMQQLKVAVDGKLSAERMDSKELGKWINDSRLNDFLKCVIHRHSAVFDEFGYLPFVNTNDTKGGKGNERIYWLAIKKITAKVDEDNQSPEDNIVHYERNNPADIQLSWFYKFIFKNGELKNKSLRGLVMITVLFGSVIGWAIYVFIFSLVLVSDEQSFTSLDLFWISCLIFFSFIMFKYWAIPLWNLPEHRVIKAPMSFISLVEDHADLEMYRDKERNQITRVTKFKGTCPICASDVLLKSGKPDQKMPLVGRCVESPFAHVYSFDRVTLKGEQLK